MEKTAWKITAIILLVLLILETSLFVWGYLTAIKETEMTNLCAYDFCKKYPQSYYADGVCTCYDYDLLGNLQEVDYKYYN